VSTVKTRVVIVEHPFQVAHDGNVYRPGDVTEVPEHVATHWATHGWVVMSSDAGIEMGKRRSTRNR